MTDSTRGHNRPLFSRPARRASLNFLLVVLITLWIAAPARADGDPASDVLAQQSLFLPQDAGLSSSQQSQLASVLRNAAQSGYPIRVAMIASSADLGSVAELWDQPQSYAEFLGQELALVYRGPLLVIMPRGLGLYRHDQAPAAERSALAALPPPTAAAGLGTAALTSIQRLAAAAGHQVSIPNATVPSTPTSDHTGAWIVFAGGCALIALAWIASLRAHPPHLRRKRSRPTSTL